MNDLPRPQEDGVRHRTGKCPESAGIVQTLRVRLGFEFGMSSESVRGHSRRKRAGLMPQPGEPKCGTKRNESPCGDNEFSRDGWFKVETIKTYSGAYNG